VAEPSAVRPSAHSSPRATTDDRAADQSSADQPRTCRICSEPNPETGNCRCVASRPDNPFASNAAMCPSPRCSRTVVAICQSAATGSSGNGSAAFAVPSGRAVADSTRGDSSATASAHAPADTPTPRSTSPATADRAASTDDADARDHADGSDLATIDGSNTANIATTPGAVTGPSGAARKAK
jgi:hypothetical protein